MGGMFQCNAWMAVMLLPTAGEKSYCSSELYIFLNAGSVGTFDIAIRSLAAIQHASASCEKREYVYHDREGSIVTLKWENPAKVGRLASL